MYKSRIFGGVSSCSETVNSVVVFIFLPMGASGEFCSVKLLLGFFCGFFFPFFNSSMGLCMIKGIDQTQRVCEP